MLELELGLLTPTSTNVCSPNVQILQIMLTLALGLELVPAGHNHRMFFAEDTLETLAQF